MEAREDKDRVDGPILPALLTTQSTQSRTRRWKRRLHSLPVIPRATRLVRWVLGPSRPVSDLPRPHPSISLSLTLPSKSWSIPLDQSIQTWSKRWKLHYALYPFLALWAMTFVLLIRQQYYTSSPGIIACTASVWDDWPPDVCGLNGTDCKDALEEMTYRCMGGCLDTRLGNPRWVGGEQVNGVPLVIGGNDQTYRADSWVCPAAIHSGLISSRLGGCVSLKPLDFPSGISNLLGSTSHGVASLSFSPSYPGAYSLEFGNGSGCLDLHPIITAVNAVFLLIVTLFLSPSPGVLFTILVILGYLQIVLISDPSSLPPDWSWIFGGLPQVLLTGYWAWHVSFSRTLPAFTHLPVEVTLWQGVGFWLGTESSTIFNKLPIQRLGYGALSASGVISLVVILVVVVILVLIQAWQMRKYGMLQYYLIRYLPLAPILIILAFIPNYTLRLHHYLFSLAAIPVLSLLNRVSLFGQAFAFALFLDGVGRWGWDSILEHTASLLGDANAGTEVPWFNPNTSTSTNISWFPLTPFVQAGYDGVAMIVDDILRAGNITGSSYPIGNLSLSSGIDHFFRLAYMINGTTQDYIDPIVLSANGTWKDLGY